MYLCKSFTVLLLCIIIYYANANFILNIRIFNYRNEDNLKHDGTKCESFHWVGDHCDPMFKICVTENYQCDILNKEINFWKNVKSLYTVLLQDIELPRKPNYISIKVVVDDHDRFDPPDHIAVFRAKFSPIILNTPDRKIMEVFPRSLNVGLHTSVSLRCAKNRFGPLCIKNDCQSQCGHGTCELNSLKNKFNCQCDNGWSGTWCRSFETKKCSLLNCELLCKYTETTKTCRCKIQIGNYEKLCRETINLSQITSSIIKPSTSQKSFFTKNLFPTTSKDIPKHSESPVIKMLTTQKRKKPLPKTEIITFQTTTNQQVFIDSFKKNSSEKKAKYLQKHSDENNVKINYSPSTIIIMVLLLLLCICVLGLGFVIRNFQKKSKININHRPLPPVLFQNDKKPTYKSYVENNTSRNGTMNSTFKSNTISSNYPKRDSNLFLITNYEVDNIDPYEEPMIDNLESLTCETDAYESNDSDIYEVPIKHNC